MQVSFDVDDTLVCPAGVPTEQFVPRWRRFWYNEPLRAGTRFLLRELLRRQCRLWVYTTSYRSPRYMHGWFKSFGIPLTGVIHQARHDRMVGRHGPSKYPPAFGIDLHVDDSEGVRIEGDRHGFSVVVIAPDDLDWVTRVLEAVEQKRTQSARG